MIPKLIWNSLINFKHSSVWLGKNDQTLLSKRIWFGVNVNLFVVSVKCCPIMTSVFGSRPKVRYKQTGSQAGLLPPWQQRHLMNGLGQFLHFLSYFIFEKNKNNLVTSNCAIKFHIMLKKTLIVLFWYSKI